ncbi:MAG: hypothetical protein K8H75_08020 [Sulfuricella sp.]|nr:hypothetical protein [Sulfuricella sp.]
MKLGIVSSHARMSMKRRGIPPQALETLFAYGRVANAPHGSRVVYFSSVGKAALSKSLPPNQIDRWADMYAVLDPQNEVITVGYRTNRIRRAKH